MKEIWTKNLNKGREILASCLESEDFLRGCELFSQEMIKCIQSKNKVMSCGNGGSHCDAMHFAEELTGRFYKERPPMGALALGDPSHVTCTANDYGFEYIFSRQVEALGREGDLLLALSTSGNSANVIKAVEKAKELNIKTVGLLGKDGGELKSMVDIPIVVPAKTSDRIQEVHIKIIHTAIETLERELYPENY